MNRFIVSGGNINESRVSLKDEHARHIVLVLRLDKGAEIEVADGLGKAYLCRLISLSKNNVTAEIITEIKKEKETNISITLAQGVAKGSKMDTIIQKATELGVKRIIPVETLRTVAKLKKEKITSRLTRWQKIAHSAAEQSGRTIVTTIDSPEDFKAVLAKAHDYDLGLIPYEEEEAISLKQTLEANPDAQKIIYFIGPEGGFTQAEIEEAKANGIIPVTLGPRIMRTETAGPVIAALLLYHYGEME